MRVFLVLAMFSSVGAIFDEDGFLNRCATLEMNGHCDVECWEPEFDEEHDCHGVPMSTLDISLVVTTTPSEVLLEDIFPGLRRIFHARVELLTSHSELEKLQKQNLNVSIYNPMNITLSFRLYYIANNVMDLSPNKIEKIRETLGVVRLNTVPPPPLSPLAIVVIAVLGCIIIALIVYSVLIRRTRKRHYEHAPVWIPPFDPTVGPSSSKKPRLSDAPILDTSIYQNVLDISTMESCYMTPLATPVRPPLPPTSRPPVVAREDPISLGTSTDLHLLADLPGYNDDDTLGNEVERLIRSGIDIEAQNEDEETVLIIAVRRGRLRLVERLLRLGADPTVMDKHNRTVLHHSVETANIPMMQLLFEKSRIGSEIVEDRKAIDCVDRHDRTPLMCAASNAMAWSLEMVKLLINNGANPLDSGDTTITTHRGRTALHYAAMYGNTTVLSYLLDNFPFDLQSEDREGCTALYHAVSFSRTPAIQLLLLYGASTQCADQLGLLPVDVARSNGRTDIVSMLERYKENCRQNYCRESTKIPRNGTKPKKYSASAQRVPDPCISSPEQHSSPSSGSTLPDERSLDGFSTQWSPHDELFYSQNLV